MENTVQLIIMGICILIIFAGLWLSIYREIRNIQKGEKDIQSLVYDKEKGTFNFSFAIGLVLLGGGLYAAIYTGKTLDAKPSLITQEATLVFSFNFSPAPEELVLHQQAPTSKNRNIIIQNGQFEESIDLPEVNGNYVSNVQPRVNSSELSSHPVSEPYIICFTRNQKEIRKDKVIAILRAGKDKIFKLDPGDPGCIVLCDPNKLSYSPSFGFLTSAMAQTNQLESENFGWMVPNLQTLLENKKTGFSQITITSKSLNNKVKESNGFYYSVKVNNTPTYIDGLLPKYIINPYIYEKGVNIDFGLENLGFSGFNKGYERIEITLNFLRDSKLIYSMSLPFEYVALRNAEPKEITGSDGSKFLWKALFKANRENQIFILSTTNVQDAVNSKNRLDTRSLRFKNNPVVGVIRPPYKNNLHYGICVGMVLPNKQIKFTFNTSEAREFAAYLKSIKYNPLIRLLSDN